MKSTDMEYTCGLTKESIKANGKETKCTEWDKQLGQTAENIQEYNIVDYILGVC